MNAKPWSKKQLDRMLLHNFLGTLADNSVEIGWVLCFSLLANKSIVERITTLFGLNDAFWVILSSTYYTTRTSMTARLPKLLKEKGEAEASKQFKNHVYLFYAMLLPAIIGAWIFLPKMLLMIGVKEADLSLYIPYFQMTLISIGLAAPWSVMVPSYYRIRGKTKLATTLDHAIAWFMLLGIFITTHVFHKGVLWAVVVNILANSIPLIYFLVKNPMENFWSKGFEFSKSDIKESWNLVKWELVRRLAPRVSGFIGAGIMISVNPIYLAVKYWLSNLATYAEGWVDAMASLLNTHVSRNVGIKNTRDKDLIPYRDNEYVFWKSALGIMITISLLYKLAVFGLGFLPESIYSNLINPLIYILLLIEIVTKTRYYMWLSISRSYRLDLNGTAQLLYAIPTAFLTPFLLWLFLIVFKLNFLGIFLTRSLISTIQWLGTEIYFKRNL